MNLEPIKLIGFKLPPPIPQHESGSTLVVNRFSNTPDWLRYHHVVIAAAISFGMFFIAPSGVAAASVAVGTILLAMVLSRVAEWKLTAPEEKRDSDLMLDAPGLVDLYIMLAILMLAILLSPAIVLLVSLFWPSASLPLWPAAAAVVVAEVNYVTWLFEGVAIKDELEAIKKELDKKKQNLSPAIRISPAPKLSARSFGHMA